MIYSFQSADLLKKPNVITFEQKEEPKAITSLRIKRIHPRLISVLDRRIFDPAVIKGDGDNITAAPLPDRSRLKNSRPSVRTMERSGRKLK